MPTLHEAARRHSWFLAGPTASGKSDVALALVDLLRDSGQSAEIVAMDSMTLYRGMDVGTAKPTPADQAHVPHHLFDILDVDETYSVADYVTAADRVCRDLLDRGHVPVFVGGTGLYLRSLLRGVFEGPPADAEIRTRLEAEAETEGPTALHARLRQVDSVTANRLEMNDVRRVVRALEVWELTGRALSEWQREETPDTIAQRVFWLEPDRTTLHERINTRVDRMLSAGWLDEAAALLDGSRPLGPTARQALGYQELFEVLEDQADLPTATERIKARTRQFAKRQHTWFRNLPECRSVGVAPGESPTDIAARLFAMTTSQTNEEAPSDSRD